MPVMVIGISMIAVDGSYWMPESFKRKDALELGQVLRWLKVGGGG